MIYHLCDDCDVAQASFVWLRIPEVLKQTPSLQEANKICRNLKELKFGDAIKMLNQTTPH